MRKFEEDIIKIKNEQGEEQTFYKMITFKSKLTDKTYLVYSDNQEPANIYASVIIDNGEDITLERINEEDQEEVIKALLKVQYTIIEINTMDGEII